MMPLKNKNNRIFGLHLLRSIAAVPVLMTQNWIFLKLNNILYNKIGIYTDLFVVECFFVLSCIIYYSVYPIHFLIIEMIDRLIINQGLPILSIWLITFRLILSIIRGLKCELLKKEIDLNPFKLTLLLI